jgi:hypothetical protein
MNFSKMKCFSEQNPSCKGTLFPIHLDKKIKTPRGTFLLRDLEVLECNICKERFYPAKTLRKISAHKNYSGKFVVRLDPEIHAELAFQAKKHHRSLNQETEYLLETAVKAS